MTAKGLIDDLFSYLGSKIRKSIGEYLIEDETSDKEVYFSNKNGTTAKMFWNDKEHLWIHWQQQRTFHRKITEGIKVDGNNFIIKETQIKGYNQGTLREFKYDDKRDEAGFQDGIIFQGEINNKSFNQNFAKALFSYSEFLHNFKQEFPSGTKKSSELENTNRMQKENLTHRHGLIQPLNRILYGPPGTGKTYHTIDLAVQIADESRWLDSEKSDENHAKNKVIFDELRNKEVPQIEFVTFHQNYSYEDFMVGIRPYINEDAAEKEELKFVKYEGVFYRMAKEARREENKSKNFVLIIDEINRANISKVFGELITLLEDDKRLGKEHELKVTLPNGEKDFGVPSNLYVVGTMNTADKSIALIDIALRRRFEFVGYYPNYKKIKDDNNRELLKGINDRIYKEKRNSADWLIGHAYFMKNEELSDIMTKKIIPLLMEYFSNNFSEVEKIIDNKWKYNLDTKRPYTWNQNSKNIKPDNESK